MIDCTDCLHNYECFEKRGRCREYVTLEMIRRQIIELNDANQKTASARSEADEAAAGKRRAGNQPETLGGAKAKARSRG